MTDYLCDNCNKTFTTKQSLNYHKTKQVCVVKVHKCRYCTNVFASKSTMYRHMRNSCKIKKQTDEEKDGIYKQLIELQDKYQDLEKKLSDIQNGTLMPTDNKLACSKKKGIVVNNTKNIDNKINVEKMNINMGTVINNNITLVAYGNEDISKLDRSEILKVLQNGYDSTLKLTESVHFNPKYPEYHNIYISNMKDKYAMMFDGKSWTLTMKDELINRIYDDKKNYIEENINDFFASLSDSRKKALERWLETVDEDKRIRKIKDEIRLLLYNKRDVVINSQSINSIDYQEPEDLDEQIKPKKILVKKNSKGTAQSSSVQDTIKPSTKITVKKGITKSATKGTVKRVKDG